MYPRMTKLERLQISSYALERSVEGKMITGPRSTIMFQVLCPHFNTVHGQYGLLQQVTCAFRDEKNAQHP